MTEAATDGRGLDSLGVLVTRPAGQAQPLCDLIRSAGGRPLRFPALEIRAPRRGLADQNLPHGLREFDLAVFVSPNAVRYGLQMLQPAGGLPADLELAAVGEATAGALADAGHTPDLVPAGRYDSEALLASPRLKRVQGQRIIIVRGEGGRTLLGTTLRQRGAEVVYAEVYRRACPDARVDGLVARWQDVDVVTATSNEILDNLEHLFGRLHRRLLHETTLLVISERMQRHARELGFQRTQRARQASDSAIVDALLKYRSRLPESQ